MTSPARQQRSDTASLIRRGRFDEAFLECTAALHAYPTDVAVLDLLIQAAAEGGLFEAAYETLKRLCIANDNAREVALAQGRLFARCGLADVAIAAMRSAIVRSPTEPLAYVILAGVFDALGRHAEARQIESIGDRLSRAIVSDGRALVEISQTWIEALDPAVEDLRRSALVGLVNSFSSDDFFDWQRRFDYADLMDAIGEPEQARLHRNLAACVRAAIADGGMDDGGEPIAEIVPPPARPSNASQDVRRVYFVAPVILPRVAKLARNLRRTGVQVILFTRANGGFLAQSEEHFDAVTTYSDYVALWNAMAATPPDAVHAFINLDDGYREGMALLAQWSDRLTVDLYDLADVKVSPYARLVNTETDYAAQLRQFHRYHRLFINHAPAICTRSIYSKLLHSAIPSVRAVQRRAYVPEMSWGNVLPRSKLSDSDGKLHVVHGGTFWAEQTRGCTWRCMYWLGEYAAALDIHFHLYPAPAGEQDMSPYERLARDSDRFHLHELLPYSEWLEASAAYDVGLFYVHPRDQRMEGEMPRVGEPSGLWANRFGDCLDTELFMVLSWRMRAVNHFAKRAGIGLAATPEMIFTRPFWDGVRSRVLGKQIDFTAAREMLARVDDGNRLRWLYRSTALAQHSRRFRQYSGND